MDMYNKLKKIKGETFAKAVRNYHTGILTIPDLVDKVKYASAKPREDILQWLYKESVSSSSKAEESYSDPFQLLKQAGYNAFLADTLEKQNSIKKYFRKGEELCTFNDSGRFENFTMIHCVKENVESVEYAPEGSPRREDAYGTSVISIQFRKGFISIKNRYNHTVPNCDNTFGSNPDNIVQGLTHALEKKYKVSFASSVKNDTPENHVVVDGMLIEYYGEINGVYYGPSTWVENGVLYVVNADYQVLADNILIDAKSKTARTVTNTDDDLTRILSLPQYQSVPWSLSKTEIVIGSMKIGLER